jgi:hypothetical protein
MRQSRRVRATAFLRFWGDCYWTVVDILREMEKKSVAIPDPMAL